MSFLYLNGWEIPVLSGSSSNKPKLIGARQMSVNGAPLTSVRGHRNMWKFETPPLPYHTGLALMRYLQGYGDFWRFDGTYNSVATPYILTQDIYSDKMVAPESGNVHTIVPLVAYDGENIKDHVFSNITGRKGALSEDPGTTNILSDDQANGVSGYLNVNGGSWVTDPSHRVHSDEAVKITTGSTTYGGISVEAASTAVSTLFVASCYLSPLANMTVRILPFTNVGTIGTGSTIGLTAGETKRVQTFFTTQGAGVTSVGFQITKTVGPLSYTLWADNLQIEERGNTYPTAWTLGTRAAGKVIYSCNPSPQGFSLSIWARGIASAYAGNSIIAKFEDPNDNTNHITIYRDPGGSGLWIDYQYTGKGSATSTDAASGLWDDDWHHIVLTAQTTTASSPTDQYHRYGTLDVYIDGVQASIGGFPPPYTVKLPKLELLTRLSVGHEASTQQWRGQLCSMHLFPFAMPTGMITAFTNVDNVYGSPWPRFYASGDFLEGQHAVLCKGIVEDIKYTACTIDNVFEPNAMQIKFSLQAVNDIFSE